MGLGFVLLFLVALVPSAHGAHPVGEAPDDGTPFTFAEDVTKEAGIGFVHADHRPDRYQEFQESTMGGACWHDYDRDGWIDLYVPDSLGPDGDGRGRLYHNLGPDAAGVVGFEDVTEEAVPHRPGMGQACVWGDYDADGHTDLFVTYAVAEYSLQSSVLYRNLGPDGSGAVRFEDVTASAGISGDADDPESEHACLPQTEDEDGRIHGFCLTVGAAWLDHDLDGDLDLYIGNYANAPEGACSGPYLPNPIFCTGQANRLFRNEANGTFTEVGQTTRTQYNGDGSHGRSLGIVTTDLNGDSWPDIYVANDMDANALLLNNQRGFFHQAAFTANADGFGPRVYGADSPRGGMGVDATDLDGDGLLDLFSTHLELQYDAVLLARHTEDGLYWQELGDNATGVAAMARTVSRWGGGFVDLDLDTRKDIFAVSGHQFSEQPGPITLLMARGDDYVAQTAPVWPWGNDTQESHRNHRGAAEADHDNDGDMDLFVTALESQRGPGIPRLLAFRTADTDGLGAHPDNPGRGHHWLRVSLEATESAREAIGAHVAVTLENGTELHEWATSGGSYLNDNDPRLLFGLGDQTRGTLTITWPGGTVDGPHPFDLEGRPGRHLEFVEPDMRAPPPARWTDDAQAGPGVVTVRWAGTHLPDFAAYRVYLGQGAPPRGTTGLDTAEMFVFTDRDVHEAKIPVPDGGKVWLRTTVVDQGGHESGPSGFIRAQVVAQVLPLPSLVPLGAGAAVLAFVLRRRR